MIRICTVTFGGGNEFFKAWGASDDAEATRLVHICLEPGVSMFDSADGYSNGLAEEIREGGILLDCHCLTLLALCGARWDQQPC